MRDTKFQIGKFFRTLSICGCLILARTFGYYVHSGWDGINEYAQYRWRGQEYRIPTFPKPCKHPQQQS